MDGTGDIARFECVGTMAIGKDGGIFVQDKINCCIRHVSVDGVVSTSTIVGASWSVFRSQVVGPLCVHADGSLLIADNGRIFKAVTVRDTDLQVVAESNLCIADELFLDPTESRLYLKVPFARDHRRDAISSFAIQMINLTSSKIEKWREALRSPDMSDAYC